MVPEYAVQLGYHRMIVGQNRSLKLVQGLFDLCRIQLHSLTPVLPSDADGARHADMEYYFCASPRLAREAVATPLR
jgi:hypothetical protein